MYFERHLLSILKGGNSFVFASASLCEYKYFNFSFLEANSLIIVFTTEEPVLKDTESSEEDSDDDCSGEEDSDEDDNGEDDSGEENSAASARVVDP